ncbi:MAG: minichromosome maintenance protein MCM [Candidatus Methanofastidiosa archaeon]|nr:minichromosome maintenance protein MCM [Candidatus Methanofastidiosa archaeon]
MIDDYDSIITGFRDFFETYPDIAFPKYKTIIEEMRLEEKSSLHVDCDDLIAFDQDLYLKLVNDPMDVLPIAEQVLQECIPEAPASTLRVRFHNLDGTMCRGIRSIRAQDIHKLIQVNAIVGRTSEVKPEIIEAVFECERCGEIIFMKQGANDFKKPTACINPTCGKAGPFKLLEEQSKFIDWQLLKVQERPESLRGGRMPQHITCFLRDDMVDKAQAGSRVTMVGILKTVQDIQFKIKKTTFSKYLDVVSIDIMEKDVDDTTITPEEEEQIVVLASDPNVVQLIVGSIAPAIFGHNDVKEAIALQLFSGVVRELPDGTRLRGDSNILLVGDPGVAKSQILQYVARLAPRSVYTSGKGTSSAGLTAAVVRDETTGGWALEAGALVLADGGVACIDEIDKMSSDDRSSVHEAMEQQTISIAKAGIVATLNARSSILAAANPKLGRFDNYKNELEQIDLPPSLLSRFDLIFVLKDIPNDTEDEKIATHILSTHRGMSEKITPKIDPDLMVKYISFARRSVTPELSEEASQKLHKFYIGLRKKGQDSGAIPITARQLEALIRLSEARARMKLSNVVTSEDSDATISLYRSVLEKVMTDKDSGDMDVDILMTGKASSQRHKIIVVFEIIEEIEKGHDEGAPYDDVIKTAKERGISKEFVARAVEELKRGGDIFEPRAGRLKTVRSNF